MPKFSNIENERVELPDGRVIWLSRSCAVVITIIIRKGSERFCLLVKRGEGCPDEVGKWVLPCGYLDNNETLAKGAERELFEEAGFSIEEAIASDLHMDTNKVVLNNFESGQPWFVYSGKTDAKENVSHYFGAFIELEEDDNLPELSDENCEPGEVAELKWVPLKDLKKYEIGFNHEKRIPMYLKKIRWYDCYPARLWRKFKRWYK